MMMKLTLSQIDEVGAQNPVYINPKYVVRIHHNSKGSCIELVGDMCSYVTEQPKEIIVQMLARGGRDA